MPGQRDFDSLREYQERWERETLRANLANRPEQKETFTTVSGKAVKGVYTPLDSAGLDYVRDLANPGDYPFTRGIHATGYRSKPWTLRIFAGFGSAEETNARYKYLIEQGNKGLSVAFDLPTLMGYDSDAPEALGEFGKCGVAVSCLRDMEILFDGIPLDQISTSMTINSPAPIIWAYYIAVAQKRGIPLDQLRGTLQNDILKEYIAQKEYIFPPEPAMRLVTDTIEHASLHLPKWNSISVSGYHIREAGSTAAQELAFTLLDGMEYVRWAIERDLDVDEFAPRISFFFNAHNDFFEEIAKYRAARRIWARQMRETFGAKDPRSWLMRFHTQTAGVSLTLQQPEVNLVRVAIQALAGVLGGTQSLHTNSMDEALALPSEHAATLAMRTQQVILEESGVVNTVDPLGGSYFVETLTDEIEAEANDYFRRVDELGGVLAALDAGFFMREIAEASYRYMREVEAGERAIVGVNKHADQEADLKIPILKMDPQGYDRQVARLECLRRERDSETTARSLSALKDACRGDDNVMPYLIECAKADATLGETVDVMREVFGVYEEPLNV